MPRGVPQIEVVFDVDSNGILNVSASEKSTGKSNKITVNRDKGSLSQDDIDRMVKEAEQYKEQDTQQRENIEARNSLENYVYSVKKTMDEDSIKTMTEEDKTTILENLKKTIEWIDDQTQNRTTQEYKDKQDAFEKIVKPIFMKAYAQEKVNPEQEQEPTVPDVD